MQVETELSWSGARRVAVGALSLLSLVAASGALAQAAGDRLLAVVPAQSTLGYRIVHKLHEVEASSSDLEGKALAKADGTVQVMVRTKVAGFRSGDTNRDEHMLEVMEGAQYPTVTFKGLAKIAPPAAYPASLDVSLSGELEMHGRKFPETIPVHVEMTSPAHWRVTGKFDVSLDKYGVERPALLLVKIEDACHMTIDLTLAGNP